MLFSLILAALPASAVDLGTFDMTIAGNQPPSGYTASVLHRMVLPRDEGGVIAAAGNGTVSCGWSKAKIVFAAGWPRVVVEQDRATWSTPPASTTCTTSYQGTSYSVTIAFTTRTLDYTKGITNFTTGANLALGPDAGIVGAWSVLPYSSAGYVEEQTWARKNGSTWYSAKCTVAASPVDPSEFWLRYEVDAGATCTSAQACKCRYKTVGGSYQETPLVVSR